MATTPITRVPGKTPAPIERSPAGGSPGVNPDPQTVSGAEHARRLGNLAPSGRGPVRGVFVRSAATEQIEVCGVQGTPSHHCDLIFEHEPHLSLLEKALH